MEIKTPTLKDSYTPEELAALVLPPPQASPEQHREYLLGLMSQVVQRRRSLTLRLAAKCERTALYVESFYLSEISDAVWEALVANREVTGL